MSPPETFYTIKSYTYKNKQNNNQSLVSYQFVTVALVVASEVVVDVCVFMALVEIGVVFVVFVIIDSVVPA